MDNYNFVDDGVKALKNFFSNSDLSKLKNLRDSVLSSRNLNDIFLTKKEFNIEKMYKGGNPRPGRNLIEKLETNFIFANTKFRDEMANVCGKRWRVLDYKFVMSMPSKFIPNWLAHEIEDRLIPNLGAYVKEKFRDMTYFRGIDFHQDIIDFPDRESDFITLYIYLDEVTNASSPLNILPKSHLLGSSIFPHKLTKLENEKYKYTNDYSETSDLKLLKLIGGVGSMYYWHCNILHGTQPQHDDIPRISIRILVEKNSKTKSDCFLDKANKITKGTLSLTKTRSDVDSLYKPVLKGNIINKN